MTTGARIGIGVVGAVLLLVGWAARALELETSSLGIRVLQAPDGTYGAYSPDDSYGGPFEVEETGEAGVFGVVHQGQEVLFTGTQEEAAFWIESKGAEPRFTGTQVEVEAWVDEQNAAEDADNMFWPMALMVSGGLVVIGAVAFGRDSD